MGQTKMAIWTLSTGRREYYCYCSFGKMQKGESCQYSAPKKFSNLSDTIKFASTPRKLRSALEKRHHGSQKTGAPATPDSRKEMDGSDWRFKDCTKKHKPAADEYKDVKQSLITKDEEEAAQALFALAQTLNEAEVVGVKNVSQKRCLVHVYICHFIKVVQESEGGHVSVMSDIKSICSH